MSHIWLYNSLVVHNLENLNSKKKNLQNQFQHSVLEFEEVRSTSVIEVICLWLELSQALTHKDNKILLTLPVRPEKPASFHSHQTKAGQEQNKSLNEFWRRCWAWISSQQETEVRCRVTAAVRHSLSNTWCTLEPFFSFSSQHKHCWIVSGRISQAVKKTVQLPALCLCWESDGKLHLPMIIANTAGDARAPTAPAWHFSPLSAGIYFIFYCHSLLPSRLLVKVALGFCLRRWFVLVPLLIFLLFPLSLSLFCTDVDTHHLLCATAIHTEECEMKSCEICKAWVGCLHSSVSLYCSLSLWIQQMSVEIRPSTNSLSAGFHSHIYGAASCYHILDLCDAQSSWCLSECTTPYCHVMQVQIRGPCCFLPARCSNTLSPWCSWKSALLHHQHLIYCKWFSCHLLYLGLMKTQFMLPSTSIVRQENWYYQ